MFRKKLYSQFDAELDFEFHGMNCFFFYRALAANYSEIRRLTDLSEFSKDSQSRILLNSQILSLHLPFYKPLIYRLKFLNRNIFLISVSNFFH